MQFSLCKLVSLAVMLLLSSATLYDPLKSYVSNYNTKNFDAQVTKNREKGISVVHFYKKDGKTRVLKRLDGRSEGLK